MGVLSINEHTDTLCRVKDLWKIKVTCDVPSLKSDARETLCGGEKVTIFLGNCIRNMHIESDSFLTLATRITTYISSIQNDLFKSVSDAGKVNCFAWAVQPREPYRIALLSGGGKTIFEVLFIKKETYERFIRMSMQLRTRLGW